MNLGEEKKNNTKATFLLFLSAMITLAAYKVRKEGEKVQESLKDCFEIVWEILFDL